MELLIPASLHQDLCTPEAVQTEFPLSSYGCRPAHGLGHQSGTGNFNSLPVFSPLNFASCLLVAYHIQLDLTVCVFYPVGSVFLLPSWKRGATHSAEGASWGEAGLREEAGGWQSVSKLTQGLFVLFIHLHWTAGCGPSLCILWGADGTHIVMFSTGTQKPGSLGTRSVVSQCNSVRLKDRRVHSGPEHGFCWPLHLAWQTPPEQLCSNNSSELHPQLLSGSPEPAIALALGMLSKHGQSASRLCTWRDRAALLWAAIVVLFAFLRLKNFPHLRTFPL